MPPVRRGKQKSTRRGGRSVDSNRAPGSAGVPSAGLPHNPRKLISFRERWHGRSPVFAGLTISLPPGAGIKERDSDTAVAPLGVDSRRTAGRTYNAPGVFKVLPRKAPARAHREQPRPTYSPSVRLGRANLPFNWAGSRPERHAYLFTGIAGGPWGRSYCGRGEIGTLPCPARSKTN